MYNKMRDLFLEKQEAFGMCIAPNIRDERTIPVVGSDSSVRCDWRYPRKKASSPIPIGNARRGLTVLSEVLQVAVDSFSGKAK